MNVYITCPVEKATDEEKLKLEAYVKTLEAMGVNVYYPARDTNQADYTGFRICEDNRKAIANADEVHLFWCNHSRGSIFDMGMAFALRKPIWIINMEDMMQYINGKSLEHMYSYWDSLSNEHRDIFFDTILDSKRKNNNKNDS